MTRLIKATISLISRSNFRNRPLTVKSHYSYRSQVFMKRFRQVHSTISRNESDRLRHEDETKAIDEEQDNLIKITFIRANGKKTVVKSEPGRSLYDVVIDNNLDFDGFGSCEGTLCCTTCHLIFNEQDYKKLEEFKKPEEEELNMLDLADGLCDTSRLGCQVILPEGIKSIDVHVPPSISDIRLD